MAHSDPYALLRWQVEMGADEAIGEAPANRLVTPPPVTRPSANASGVAE